MKHVVVCVRTIHQLYSQSIRLKWILAFSLSVVLGSVTGLTSTVALAELPAAQDPGALVFDNIPAPEPKGPTNVIHSGPNTEILREVSENSEQIIRFTYQIQNSSNEILWNGATVYNLYSESHNHAACQAVGDVVTELTGHQADVTSSTTLYGVPECLIRTGTE